ncbi:MAG TPA: hypothetical protein VMF69_27065, partial [Gemmataceae bacterium]|nr:hypothetical protein [Gemmataceae bacterium]
MSEKAIRSNGISGRMCWALSIAVLIGGSTARAAGPWTALVDPDNSIAFSFLHDDKPVFRVGLGGWGPRWAWVGMQSRKKAKNNRLSLRVPFVVNKDKGKTIDIQFEAWQPAARQVAFRYDLEASRDVPLTMLIAGVNFEPDGSQGTLTLTHANRQESKLALPIRGIRAAPETSQAAFAFDKCGTIAMRIDPPSPIAFDNGMRVVLASELFRKGKRSVTLTLTFPEEVAFFAKQSDLDKFTRTLAGPDWFAFQPSKDVKPGIIDMDGWLDRPAGKHGGVRMVKDRFEFEDGTPVK